MAESPESIGPHFIPFRGRGGNPRRNFPVTFLRKSIPLCQSEHPPLPDQLCHVLVHDAAAVLYRVSARDGELWPVVPHLLERAVPAALGRAIVHDGHRHLHVGVLHLGRAHDEIALKLADVPHAHLTAQAPRVTVDEIISSIITAHSIAPLTSCAADSGSHSILSPKFAISSSYTCMKSRIVPRCLGNMSSQYAGMVS